MLDLNKNLEAGGRLNLSKDHEGNKLSKIFFGSNWGAIRSSSGFLGFGGSSEKVDLDASVIILDENKKVIDEVAFYHLISKDGAIKHSGDDRSGDTDGDDGLDNEIISVDLDRVNPKAHHLVFILNSFTQQKFEKIPYMGLRIYTTANGMPLRSTRDEGTILAKFNQDGSPDLFKGKKAIILGDAYRHNSEWKFRAIGVTSDANNIETIKRELISFI